MIVKLQTSRRFVSFPALLLTVCVDGVEHGHDPLLEGGGEVIVLFTLANVLQ